MIRNILGYLPAWSRWLIGAITFLALTILLLAIVLGVQAGQRQLEIQWRNDAALSLQQALNYHAEGNFAAARLAYEQVLILDPDNTTALAGFTQLQSLPTAPAVGSIHTATTMGALPTNISPVPPTPAFTSTASTTDQQSQWLDAAKAAYNAGRWLEVITYAQRLRQADVNYAAEQVDELLFESYINLATEKDNQNKLQEALQLFDKALELRPNDVATLRERDLITLYLTALTYMDADWSKTVDVLQQIYAKEPEYRDVQQRLYGALISYAEVLADQALWCDAAQQLAAAQTLNADNETKTTLALYQERCENLGNAETPAATIAASALTEAPTATIEADVTATATTATTATATSLSTSGLRGRLLYSAADSATGRNRIMIQSVGGSAVLLYEDATQPALRQDGQRLIFHNTRNDMGGLSAWDPGTNLLIRFTSYAEDSQPSWNPQGNQVVFASNREGDRRWRIYVTWAQEGGDTTSLGFGESPSWHPNQDRIAFRGCDTSGNNCGLWLMDSSGNNRAPLTAVTADNRPAWGPDGRFVLFMSDGRDGNLDIYRVEVASGEVSRLTDHPAMDGLPAVSPDGRFVAFVSNRDGAWKIWVTSSNGSTPTLLAPINGNLGNWLEQDLQWVN